MANVILRALTKLVRGKYFLKGSKVLEASGGWIREAIGVYNAKDNNGNTNSLVACRFIKGGAVSRKT